MSHRLAQSEGSSAEIGGLALDRAACQKVQQGAGVTSPHDVLRWGQQPRAGLWLSSSRTSPRSQKQGHMHTASPGPPDCDLGMRQVEPCSSA